jgi:CRP-like cAMP-binding protein
MRRINNEALIRKYVKQFNITSYFDDQIIEVLKLFQFDKDEHICRSEEDLNYLYFFVSGKAKVYNLLENGRSQLLRFYTPLQIIGDLEVFNERKAHSNIETITDCYCLAVSFAIVDQHYINHPNFLKKICKNLGYKLQTVSRQSSINQLYTLEERLASYLIATTTVEEQQKAEIHASNLTDLSNLLGSSYRHLLRVIKKMSDEQLIKKEGKKIIILNYKQLQAKAGDIYE